MNLCVDNLAEARTFFENLFDFQCLEQKGDAIAVMDDGHGFVLVLSDSRAFGHEVPPRYPESFHVGFVQDTPAQVTAIYNRLQAGGINPGQQPKKVRGSYGFYFTALTSILFEVTCPLE